MKSRHDCEARIGVQRQAKIDADNEACNLRIECAALRSDLVAARDAIFTEGLARIEAEKQRDEARAALDALIDACAFPLRALRALNSRALDSRVALPLTNALEKARRHQTDRRR